MANTNQSNKIVPVFFGCDNRFTPYFMTCLASLIDHTSKRRKYEIHVLHTDIEEATEELVKKMETPNVSIEFNNVSESIKDITSNLPIRDYYSPSTYFRLLIAHDFPQYHKAVYIDSDMIVMDDIAKLYDTQLGNSYVGAVPEAVLSVLPACSAYVSKVLNIEPRKYFNAGMLVINCDAWRKNDILSQFLFLIGYYNFVVAQDQDYLNVICKNKVHYIPRRWNMETLHPWNIPENNLGIIHYAFVAKPWQDINCLYGYYFWKYASTLPVYDTIKAGFAAVTAEKLASINAVTTNVIEACENEIARNDNFIHLVEKNKTAKPLLSQPQLAELVTRIRAHA